MKKLIPFIFSILSIPAFAAVGDPVDCSSAYQDLNSPVACRVIACDAKFESFLGTWEGPFEAFDRVLKVYRPLRNQVKYSADDCLQNVEPGHSGFGDTFIVGRKIDIYPSFQTAKGKTDIGLLITGKHKDGSPFLRTISSLREADRPDETLVEYQLEMQNEATITSVWSSVFKKAYQDDCGDKKPETTCDYDLKFTVIDGKEMSDLKNDTRNVSVKMEMFLSSTGDKVGEQITNRGFHSKKK